MIPEERQRRILAVLDADDIVRPADLADRLNVSVETIRRDLLALEQSGQVRRVYGGATRARHSSRSTEPVRAERVMLHQSAKEEIGRLAAGLVSDQDTIFIDVGTTACQVARYLAPTFHGRVITNNVLVVTALAERPEVSLHMLGGRVRHDELSCSGPDAEEQASRYYADKAFLGSGGVHPGAGLTDYHIDEIGVRQHMITNASGIYVLADASKLGHVALRQVCGWDRITGVITDASAEREMVRQLRELTTVLLHETASEAKE
jgi:DeoR/GlpR family transcriptional regulator of sugar metabolism